MGEIVTNPDAQPINVSTAWTPLLDVNTMSYFGMNVVTLTEWNTGTVRPQIAQGSAIDIDGSVARFITPEAIGGTPIDGTVYVKFIVAAAVVTAELTAEAPTWTNTLGGWYNGSGERYSGHLMTQNGAAYTDKRKWRDESDGRRRRRPSCHGCPDTGDPACDCSRWLPEGFSSEHRDRHTGETHREASGSSSGTCGASGGESQRRTHHGKAQRSWARGVNAA